MYFIFILNFNFITNFSLYCLKINLTIIDSFIVKSFIYLNYLLYFFNFQFDIINFIGLFDWVINIQVVKVISDYYLFNYFIHHFYLLFLFDYSQDIDFWSSHFSIIYSNLNL